MYKEAWGFHKVAIPVFLVVCIIIFLAGCGSIPFMDRSKKVKRTDEITGCVIKLLDQGVKANASYRVCSGIFGRTD